MVYRGITAIALAIALTAGAFTTPAAAAPDAGSAGMLWLRGAGATFPAPLIKEWIEVFQRDHPGIQITYDAVGSGEGINRFVTRSVDFGASDVIMNDAEIAKVEGGVIMVPATAGMIVLAYNLPGVQGDLKLPRDVYADIFAGKIKTWSDPRIQDANPGLVLPRRNIAVIARLDSSGTTGAFTSHLAAVRSEGNDGVLGVGKLIDWPGATMLARGNEGVAAKIKISEGAIGYVEYGFAKRLGLPVAALQNKSGRFIKPTDESGQSALAATADAPDKAAMAVSDPTAAEAYPIVTYSWLLLYETYADARKNAAIRQFVSYGMTDGQATAAKLGYVALPASVAARGRAAIERSGY